jgi:hypothetical protein
MPGSIRALRRRADPVRGGGRIPLVKKRTAGRPQFRTAGTDTLSAQEERIADTVEAAFNRVPQQTLLDSLERRDEAGYALAVLNALSDAQGSIEAALLASFVSSGETSAIDLGRELSRQYRQVGKAETPSPSEVALRFRFNATDPRATAWAQAEAGRLITNMATSQREVFRALVEQSFVESRTMGTTASSIFQQLQTVTPSPTASAFADSIGTNLNGLTTRYERAVMNRVAAVADDLADRGVDGVKALERMRKEGDKYATKLRRARSRTIARTERMMAHNQARLLSYQQAIDSGLMSREYSRKVWSTGPFDVCPICVAMSGVEAKVADPFTLPNGAQVQAPPGHPNCRCTLQTRTDTMLYDPPRALGTGEPGDPFRIGRPGFSAEGERLRGIRLPSVPVPTATAVPQPPPPEPVAPPPPAPTGNDPLAGRLVYEPMEKDSAIRLYQSGDANSGFTNKKLMAEKFDQLNEEQLRYVRGLDEAMTPATETTTLYRGLDLNTFRERESDLVDLYRNLKPGDQVRQGGFISTSKSKSTANQFARADYIEVRRDKGGILFEIEAPEGTGRIDIPNLSGSKKRGKFNNEEEVLLERGATLVVDSVRRGPNNITTVKARLVRMADEIAELG